MPGGESLLDVQARAIRTIERITNAHPAESSLLLCSHSFVNRTILCYSLEVPLNRFRELRQETTGLNVLYKRGQRFCTEVVNERSHLQKDGEKKAP